MSLFDKFNVFLEEKFMPIAGKIGGQKHLQAIRDGLILSMPLTIAGSIFMILAFLPIPGYYDFMLGIFGDTWMGKVLYPVRATFDIMSIFGCIGIAYRLAEKNKVDCLSSVALALMTFMILTPYKGFIYEYQCRGYSISIYRKCRIIWSDNSLTYIS